MSHTDPSPGVLAGPPQPGSNAAAQVVLKPRKALPFFGRHPWVFPAAIQDVRGTPRDGDAVELLTSQGDFIAHGAWNSRSKVRVRLYSWSREAVLDDSFWRQRIRGAIALRRSLGLLGERRACRLVFSEGDGISGLIVDWYDGHLIVQLHALAMEARWPQLQQVLVDELHPHGIQVRNDPAIAKEEGLGGAAHTTGDIPTAPIFIDEHGLRYGVELAAGQKTGFYLDQAENRLAAARYCRDRRVLDMFCYTGGFGLTALVAGQASEVEAYDSSERAIAVARANAELNGVTRIRFHKQDAFAALEQGVDRGERFGVVVLDPPKFARSRNKLDEALRAYYRINRLAAELLEPDGILVTCSCSGGVAREDFLAVLSTVAQKSRRDLQILEQRGASPDHPVSSTCLETEYLKCFICRVR